MKFHMTFPSQYDSASLNEKKEIVTRVINKKYELRIITVKTPMGNDARVYDLERSLWYFKKGWR